AISATSHFGIVLTSPVGFAAHYVQHDIDWALVLPLVVGGLCGGPIGARLSLRLKSPRLMLFVAVALTIAAFALVLRHVVSL
ncbi:MAG TPA: sulfite exporter TauE/SafE family protein, partial [Candidatus Baltobacteraceae bacterium]|nr:sulfite exporter TauE/SafE family protein [Candidatus Baltobacteraceae bacterium]